MNTTSDSFHNSYIPKALECLQETPEDMVVLAISHNKHCCPVATWVVQSALTAHFPSFHFITFVLLILSSPSEAPSVNLSPP